ncbi:MAG: rod shape-determining protein [Solirubrobacterales bacterium]|nr:rod shape-determining protein [Solirubrobacterales bacterium]
MSDETKNGNGKHPAAVIDIGSNTTRLLVAEKSGDGFRQLLSQRAFTRLGRGLKEDGSITHKKIDELARTISTQVKLAKVLGADDVYAMATAATRDATNGDELVDTVEEQSGVRIDVLDEHDEARLAFLGATHSMSEQEGSIAVVDVGGGSTEIAVGTLKEGVKWSTSFRIGSGMITDRHIHNDPPSVDDLDAARRAITAMFDEFPFPKVDHAIAIGGSASSMRRMVGNVLEHETMERAIRLITRNDASEVAEEFGLDPERVQVLPAGVMILEDIGDRLEIPLRIGKGGLREGKLLELLS